MSQITTYQQAVDFIQNLTNLHNPKQFERKVAHRYYQERMDVLLNLLDNPQKSFKFIHVSGTNGKGSTIAMMHSILHHGNKIVGSYTSPHVCTFAERIKVGNKIISPNELITIVNQLKLVLEIYFTDYSFDGITFSELLLLISFIHFKNQNCEYVIIEVGCGGKNDPTNIIPAPEIAIITNVGLDHLITIGPTIKDIAQEKSGIIKKGSYFLTQEQNSEASDIFKKHCTNISAKYGKYSHEFTLLKSELTFSEIEYESVKYTINLAGNHQITNALLCIAAGKYLNIDEPAIQSGLAQCKIPGRFEIMQTNPLVILDGAHNAEKLEALVKQVNEQIIDKKIWVLYSSTAGKTMDSTLEKLAHIADEIVCTRHNMTFRKAANPKNLIQCIKKVKPNSKPKYFLQAQEGFEYILQNAKETDLIIVTGSLYMIGLIREHWISEKYILENQTLFK